MSDYDNIVNNGKAAMSNPNLSELEHIDELYDIIMEIPGVLTGPSVATDIKTAVAKIEFLLDSSSDETSVKPKSHMIRTIRCYRVIIETQAENPEKGIQEGMKIEQTFIADCCRVAFENAGIHFAATYGVPFRVLSIVECGTAVIDS